MTVLLPRDKNASRNIKPAKSLLGPKSADVNLNKPRDINQPSILPSDKKINDKAKKVFIKTYGCQMNVYDSERMVDVLSPIGYAPVETPENADLVILNTCHIREKAAEKVYSELGRIRQLKKKVNPEMKVAVAGCVAQAEGSEIKRRAPVVDMVLGPQTYHKLPEMIAKVHRNSGEVLETDFDTLEKFDNLPESRQVKGFSSFLTIQEGCDKFCTFCVVPYTRGAEVSRPVDQVINEARNLASQGVKEITLIGQNVDAYSIMGPNSKQWGLGELISHVALIGGIDRLRFTTSHPRDMDDDLISILGKEPKLMPYLHLPIQAGSDKVLKAMNRGHTYEEYKTLIGKIRKSRPDIALSGDFIVGFPGETESDFQQTMKCVEEIGYASSFSFKYSVRPGTPGASLPQQVSEDVKSDRLKRLQDLLYSQQHAFNESLVGRTLNVLIENVGREEKQLFGRSPYLQGTHFNGPADLIGQIRPVLITKAGRNSLSGELIQK
ncbi:tRNA (N6-isopentenyl adenosine(37)-C2)-methylthiotransferase MiaB [Hellea sp.]|jgi:tRNA-2-methylthio-N6-dimethylallyladenosine synthase|nr:tRNA (N6-isopentenyl adenosine(37)-C2)-methylthiotransferase MiaB [Hellea sp.]MBT3593936.1 tRNA (N6-isopentenyl adenosine(37)-C2)-methylthiotransferase MiaB [Hellea sp.]MDA8888873.1 tRNA (N6-isopentenyl adenosine(37)-C2)-methylthiotransferase MiaB [Hellea sp.]MDB4845158.1 tRNA (N6-isopentenyl adenosine(37)-C2)-methylthiotransferase MiaB [Hellea sp.]MDC0422310.1 tRNA (N6-isopentenyl adenosine(37)-C2)-methylthiotransferase MiaB [Hellea sp.]MDC0651207.1 tRNA (N6-isopentenyl adenosine(37)-C2)-m